MSERLIPFGKINENYSLFHRLWVHREEGGECCRKAPSNPPVSSFRWGKWEIYEVVRLTWSKRRGQKEKHSQRKKEETQANGAKSCLCVWNVFARSHAARPFVTLRVGICVCVCEGAHPCMWVWNVTRIKLLPMLNCHSARRGSWRQKRLGWVPETTLVKRP